MKKDEWVDCFLGKWPFRFKNFLFIAKNFVMPSLNVSTKANLGFIPFLILCCDIFSAIS